MTRCEIIGSWAGFAAHGFERDFVPRAVVEDGGEFEINDAEASVARAVGDVAEILVLVPHAILLELGEELLLAVGVDAVDPAAAVRGHDGERGGSGVEQTR